MSQEADHPERFDDFYTAYQPKLLRFVLRTARMDDLPESKLDAEGVVHETFEQALRAWQRIDHPERWIFRVAARKVRHHSRREWNQERELRRHLGTVRSTESGPDPAHAQALASDVIARIMALPTNQRIATYLHHVEQWTGAEIAELLDIAPGTVGTHIHRGTMHVRAEAGHAYQVAGDRPIHYHRDQHRDAPAHYRPGRKYTVGYGIRLLLPLLIVGLVTLALFWRSLVPWALGAVAGVVVVGAIVWVAREVAWRKR